MNALERAEAIEPDNRGARFLRELDGVADDASVNIEVSLVDISISHAFVLHACRVVKVDA